MAEPAPDNVVTASVSGTSHAGEAGAVESIELGPKVTLFLEQDALVVHDRSPCRSHRTSCPPISSSQRTNTLSIPLYNILWAELSPDSQILVIDYAEEVKKTRLGAAKLSFPVPPIASAAHITTFLTTLLSRSYGRARQRKRAYVLINPKSGPGGALELFEREARPVFEAARMELTVVTTTHQEHATELARDMDLEAFDVVVACSGDGLPHEVFNGLGRRQGDARAALGGMPVVMLPCGSGNAMACNLYGTHRPSFAALAIVKGVETPLDLVSVTQGSKRTLSFLSQSMGLIADLDITTEGMRWLGSTRFTVGFFWLVWKKNLYPCDLAVKVEIDHKDSVREHYRSRMEGGGGENGEDAGQKSDRESDATRIATPGQDEDGALPPLKYGTVQDKLPEGWEIIRHEKLWSFYCGNMAYMSPGLDFFPAAMANDGLMDLVTIDGPVSAAKAVGIQLGVESGQYFDNPLIKYRKVSAYRVIPIGEDRNGIISIDGEQAAFEPFQAEIHPGLGRTLSKVGGYENPGPKHWDKVTNSERLLA